MNALAQKVSQKDEENQMEDIINYVQCIIFMYQSHSLITQRFLVEILLVNVHPLSYPSAVLANQRVFHFYNFSKWFESLKISFGTF